MYHPCPRIPRPHREDIFFRHQIADRGLDSPRVNQDMGVEFGRFGPTDAPIGHQIVDRGLDSPWVNQRLREKQFDSPKVNQDMGVKFGGFGRTDAPIALPLGVPRVFCNDVGGLVRARARHFGALRKPL